MLSVLAGMVCVGPSNDGYERSSPLADADVDGYEGSVVPPPCRGVERPSPERNLLRMRSDLSEASSVMLELRVEEDAS